MRIGVISDTHSRLETIAKVIALLREHPLEAVLHCGDIEDAETVRHFRGLPMHFVYGNCDDDRAGIKQAVAEIGATLHDPFGSLELAGKRIAFIHSDDRTMFRDVENSGQFDYLFYGHTHQAKEHRTGPTRVINPGALHRARPKTFIVLDLAAGEVETIVVD